MKAFNKNSLEANSTLLLILMMGANVLNYFFQIIVGRMLTVEEYAVVNTLLSIITVFSVPCAAITIVAAKYIAVYRATGKREQEKIFLRTIAKYILILGVLTIAVGILGCGVISDILNLESKMYVILSLIVSGLTLIVAPLRGIQQGVQDFWGYGVQNFVTIFIKLIGSVTLIWLGWKIYGVMVAMLIGTILTILYCLCNLKSFFRELKKTKISENVFVDCKALLKLMISTVVVQLCINFMTNGDILLVKSLFDDTQTGLYSSAMVIGKIAMYVSGAVVAAMFPMVAEQYSQGKSTRALFVKSNLYGGGMAILCAVGMILLGKPIIGIFFGTRYMEAIDLLPAVCAFVIPVTFLTVISNYAVAVEQVWMVTVTLALGLLGCIVSAMLFHDTIMQMFAGIGIILSMITVIDIIYLIKCDKGCKADERED